MIFAIITAIDSVIIALCGVSMYRTKRVAKLRRQILDDIFKFMDYEWRLKVYESVSFEKMVFNWRPIKPESFYKDLTFMQGYMPSQPVKSPLQMSKH